MYEGSIYVRRPNSTVFTLNFFVFCVIEANLITLTTGDIIVNEILVPTRLQGVVALETKTRILTAIKT